jgi:hypothetical protein
MNESICGVGMRNDRQGLCSLASAAADCGYTASQMQDCVEIEAPDAPIAYMLHKLHAVGNVPW